MPLLIFLLQFAIALGVYSALFLCIRYVYFNRKVRAISLRRVAPLGATIMFLILWGIIGVIPNSLAFVTMLALVRCL